MNDLKELIELAEKHESFQDKVHPAGVFTGNLISVEYVELGQNNIPAFRYTSVIESEDPTESDYDYVNNVFLTHEVGRAIAAKNLTKLCKDLNLIAKDEKLSDYNLETDIFPKLTNIDVVITIKHTESNGRKYEQVTYTVNK